MSHDILDPEILADFIIEAKEHLETIEPTLLELEREPENLDLLNDIFRPMHSLKGASGFLGLDIMNALTHRAENVLDELRKGTIQVTTNIMDVILEATDALRLIIDNLETTNSEGDVDTSSLNKALDSLMDGGEGEEEDNPSDASLNIDEEGHQIIGDVEGWIQERPAVDPYTLVTFGEDHLRDFVEEAKENCTSLSEDLLVLEKEPENMDLVNEMFRLFHNLKGNSGIVGYQELNSLTHEAETLLNDVRKGDFEVTTALVDLLLLSVDVLDALIARIDISNGDVTPFSTDELVDKLQQAIATSKIEMPESILVTPEGDPEAKADQDQPKVDVAQHDHSESDIDIFEETINQQISAIESALEALKEDGTNKDMADALFRSLDTIKNACNVMDLEEVKLYAERTSGIVDQGRKTDMDFGLLLDILNQECAILRNLIEAEIEKLRIALSGGAESPEETKEEVTKEPEKSAEEKPAEPAKAEKAPEEKVKKEAKKDAKKEAPKKAKTPAPKTEAPRVSATIRVEHDKLDHLMNVIGEIIINRNRFTMLARQLEEVESLDEVSGIAQNLSETTYSMAHISDDLQATIMQVRMVPVASVFSRFPRLVRDLSRRSNKQVDLIIEGEETELDKSVIEVIGDPLVHLIRNSVDHGIEDPEERKAAGKDPVGKVNLRASYRGNSVAIDITDDGKGIDPDNMRQVGIRKGIVTEEEAEQLDDRQALELVFAPGFSSAEEVTDISGRGVGMDVVLTNIKGLKGSISISSELGKGTTFSMILPLTLAIIDALMVDVSTERLAIPLDSVAATTKIEASRLTDMKGRKAVTLRGEVLGIVSLAEVLGLPCSMEEQDELSIVIIQDNDRHLGLVVDTLHERQEIVIKPLGEYLGDIQGISGATIMGDGGVILILDPHEIYMLATKL